MTTTAAEDEADAENVRFLRRLVDTDWSPHDLEADEEMENDSLPQLEDAIPSENRDRILPVPVPEQYRTSVNSSNRLGRHHGDESARPSFTRLDLTRRRPDSQRFAAEREILERELQHQRIQHPDRGLQDEEVERTVRLQGILSRLNRLQEPAYGDRIPSQQSLYDWAPANDEDDGQELEDILRELRQQQPNTHPEILRVLGRSQLDAERETRNRAYSSRFLNSHTSSHPQSSETSLRSAAILQSVRRHPRFAARSRDRLQRYVMERERIGNDSEDRDRSSSPWIFPPSLDLPRSELDRLARQTQQRLDEVLSRDGQARLDAHRRSRPDHSSSPNASSSRYLESAIKYLSRLRDSTCYEQSLSYAVDGGFLTKDFFGEQHDDFILDPELLLPPPPSSWLAPGMVFEGSQHATATFISNSPLSQPYSNAHGESSTTVYRLPNSQSITSRTFDPTISRPGTASLDASRPWLSHSFTPPLATGESGQTSNVATAQDNWPVRVTVHAVDYENMTLSGTMEAFNVPSQPPVYNNFSSPNSNGPNAFNFGNDVLAHNTYVPTPTSAASPSLPPLPTTSASTPTSKGSPITTYLEGEILDFERFHTLQTTSFPSNLSTDAVYWRKLPPFSHHDADEKVVRQLVSKKGYEALRRDWILMRWKERHFVKTVGRDCWGRYMGASSASNRSASASAAAATVASNADPALAPVEMTASVEAEAEKMRLDGVPSPAAGDSMQGHGLTISGFYYVCMRRADGKVEGLYYDPQSSPYQHLRLSPIRAPGMGLAASGLR